MFEGKAGGNLPPVRLFYVKYEIVKVRFLAQPRQPIKKRAASGFSPCAELCN